MTQDSERQAGKPGATLLHPVSPTDSRMARELLGWSLGDLAKASGVYEATLALFESGIASDGGDSVADALSVAFESAGLDYRPAHGAQVSTEEDTEGAVVRVVPGRPRPPRSPVLDESRTRRLRLIENGWTQDVMCHILLRGSSLSTGSSFWLSPEGRYYVMNGCCELPVRPDWLADATRRFRIVADCAKGIWVSDPRKANVPFEEIHDPSGYRACVTAAWAAIVAYENGPRIDSSPKR